MRCSKKSADSLFNLLRQQRKVVRRWAILGLTRIDLQMRTFRFTAMGTKCAIHIHAERKLSDLAARAAVDEINRIEAKYSRYLPSSFLSNINRQAAIGGLADLDEETASLFNYACDCYRLSDGLFDITSGILRRIWDFRSQRVPDKGEIKSVLPLVGLRKLSWISPKLAFPVAGMEIDFGGLAKEYAADRATIVCKSLGIDSALVDLGGDIAVLGPQPGGAPWSIGIRDPRHSDRQIARVMLSSGALASSGDYERFIVIDGKRYSHILNPLTGWPVDELATVSVVADQCLAAGTFSTIAMLKGAQGVAWLQKLEVPHLWINQSTERGCTFPFELTTDLALKQSY
jgi:thiamine biosynthesis lipoprotein